MNHDYAYCLDYDSSVCPSDCFRAQLVAQLVEELRKRKDKVGIPVAWINFRHLSECALNTPKQTNADRIRAMTDEEIADLLNQIVTEGWAYGLQGKVGWLKWLKQEVDDGKS